MGNTTEGAEMSESREYAIYRTYDGEGSWSVSANLTLAEAKSGKAYLEATRPLREGRYEIRKA